MDHACFLFMEEPPKTAWDLLVFKQIVEEALLE
jgi:hypothetical protein